MKKILSKYKNGNYKVLLLDDGTKIRYTEDDEFKPEFPENIDIKLTNICNIGCQYCHEKSKPGKIENVWTMPLNKFVESNVYKFFMSLTPGTEVSLGGGSLTSLMHQENFLKLLSELFVRNVIVNMTINQLELENIINKDSYIKLECDANKMNMSLLSTSRTSTSASFHFNLFYGLGISFKRQSKELEHIIKNYPNLVIHVINGIIEPNDLEYLANLNAKVLILGYKNFGNGEEYLKKFNTKIAENQKYLSDNLERLSKEFKVISFDNLAIEQLNMKERLSKKEWDLLYMGDDGTMTLYVDIPNMQFGKSSTSIERFNLADYDFDSKKIFKKINGDF